MHISYTGTKISTCCLLQHLEEIGYFRLVYDIWRYLENCGNAANLEKRWQPPWWKIKNATFSESSWNQNVAFFFSNRPHFRNFWGSVIYHIPNKITRSPLDVVKDRMSISLFVWPGNEFEIEVYLMNALYIDLIPVFNRLFIMNGSSFRAYIVLRHNLNILLFHYCVAFFKMHRHRLNRPISMFTESCERV